MKHQSNSSAPNNSEHVYGTPTNGGYAKSHSQSVPPKQEHMEKPLYRTASPAKIASRVVTNNTAMRDDYGSPSTAHTPLSSSGRQDTYGGGASSNYHDRISVANKLSYSSPAGAPISNHMVSSTPEMGTPYGYKTHYNAENSPMWLSTTKDMTQNYNPKSYEDSLVEATSRNLSFASSSSPPPVNRIGDGAEQPDETGKVFSFQWTNSVF